MAAWSFALVNTLGSRGGWGQVRAKSEPPIPVRQDCGGSFNQVSDYRKIGHWKREGEMDRGRAFAAVHRKRSRRKCRYEEEGGSKRGDSNPPFQTGVTKEDRVKHAGSDGRTTETKAPNIGCCGIDGTRGDHDSSGEPGRTCCPLWADHSSCMCSM